MDEIVVKEVRCKNCQRMVKVVKYPSGTVVGNCVCGNKPAKAKKRKSGWFVK